MRGNCFWRRGLEVAFGPERWGVIFYLLLRFRLLEFPRKYYFWPNGFVIRQRFFHFNDGAVGSLGARSSIIQNVIDDPMVLLRVQGVPCELLGEIDLEILPGRPHSRLLNAVHSSSADLVVEIPDNKNPRRCFFWQHPGCKHVDMPIILS